MKYASMLADKMKQHGTKGWLVNTGWTGGSYGVGSRISLKYTRAIIDAIHSGVLDNVAYAEVPLFNLQVCGQSGVGEHCCLTDRIGLGLRLLKVQLSLHVKTDEDW